MNIKFLGVFYRILSRNIIIYNQSGNLHNKYGGTQRTQRSECIPENIERIRQAVLQNPRRSEEAKTLHLPDRIVRRILHSHLEFNSNYPRASTTRFISTLTV